MRKPLARKVAAVGMAGALVSGLGIIAGCSEDKPAATVKSQTGTLDKDVEAEKNVKVMKEFYKKSIIAKRPDLARDYIHDYYIQHSKLMDQGRGGYLKFYKQLNGGIFPNFRPKTHRFIAQGDMVVMHNQFRANHKKTGKEMVLNVVDFYRLKDGKIAEHWDVVDYIAAKPFGFQPPSNVQPGIPVNPNGTAKQQSNIDLIGKTLRDVFKNQGQDYKPHPTPADLASNYIADSLKQHEAGVGQGRDGLMKQLDAYRTVYPDLNFTTQIVVASDDLVATLSVWRGHHRKTGKELLSSRSDVWRVEGGKLAEHWAVIDRFPYKGFAAAVIR